MGTDNKLPPEAQIPEPPEYPRVCRACSKALRDAGGVWVDSDGHGWCRALGPTHHAVEPAEAAPDIPQPEPPAGSVVLDSTGHAWQRRVLMGDPDAGHWYLAGARLSQTWAGLQQNYGPLTVVYTPPTGEPAAAPPASVLEADGSLRIKALHITTSEQFGTLTLAVLGHGGGEVDVLLEQEDWHALAEDLVERATGQTVEMPNPGPAVADPTPAAAPETAAPTCVACGRELTRHETWVDPQGRGYCTATHDRHRPAAAPEPPPPAGTGPTGGAS